MYPVPRRQSCKRRSDLGCSCFHHNGVFTERGPPRDMLPATHTAISRTQSTPSATLP